MTTCDASTVSLLTFLVVLFPLVVQALPMGEFPRFTADGLEHQFSM